MAFNSEEFEWSQVACSVNGRTQNACTGISWEEEIESEGIYGKGNKPIAIQDGNIKYSGTLKMHQSEFSKLLSQTGNIGLRGLKNLTFNIAYQGLTRLESRTVVGARITKIGDGYDQGDKFKIIELPWIALDVLPQ